MADIKRLLGDKYKDGMTLEEISEAFLELDLVDRSSMGNVVDKALFDRKASELAELNKKLKSKMTEDEQKEAERAARETERENLIATLMKDKAINDNKVKYLALGYDDALATETAAALAEGKMDTVFANQKRFIDAREQALKKDLLKDTPRPPAGQVGGDTDFTKQIADANSRGDMAAMAALMRMQQEAHK